MHSLKEKIKKRQDELGLTAKRSLGQNFLVSETTVQKIVDAARRIGSERIVEIGPGLGSLTDEIVKLDRPTKLIEFDSKIAQYWTVFFGEKKNVSVVECDALKFDWEALDDKKKTILVSNLPYQISSRLVIDRTLDSELLSGMILMFQKEVAQKINAKLGTSDSGFISVFIQSFWNISNLLEAGPRDFFPSPKVASRVLVFQPKNSILPVGYDREVKGKKSSSHMAASSAANNFMADFNAIDKRFKVNEFDRQKYFSLLKASFSSPRKLLISNLKNVLKIEREVLEKLFNDLNLELNSRAEELEIRDFLLLSLKLGYC